MASRALRVPRAGTTWRGRPAELRGRSAQESRGCRQAPNGALLVEVPAEDAADLEIGAEVEVRRAQLVPLSEWPAPFGALAGRIPSIEVEDIKAARREALLSTLP